MSESSGNLFADLPDDVSCEIVEVLALNPKVRIERIVSHGQATPSDFVYDQKQAEFVVLLSGAAELRFLDEPNPRQLAPGDWVAIAPHRHHRVEWTDAATPTVWLAIFYDG
ncbi:MAG: cupin domain-containing protein [Pirellulales bacterium]